MSGDLSADVDTNGERDNYVRGILAMLDRNPHRIVVRWRGHEFTASRFAAATITATAALRRIGVDATTTVAVLAEANSPTMLITRYASHVLGAAFVHVRSTNPRSDAEMMPMATQVDVLRETEVGVLVVDGAHCELAVAISRDLPGLSIVGSGGCVADTTTFEPVEVAEYVPGNRAVIDLTSGSTGRPKKISQSFRAWNAQVELLSAAFDPSDPPRILVVTPVSHTTAPMVDAVLAAGGTVVLHEGFDATEVLQVIAEERITHIYLAVPHLYRLVDHVDVAAADLSSLRQVIYSGSPAAPRRVAQAVQVFGDALVQVYGTTESGGITSLSPMDHREPGLLQTVGRPFPWVRVEIRDRAASREVERGETGEIWTASATTMDGYLGEAALTDSVLRGGWLRTGDLGHWDRHGYLRLDGRIAEAIKVGGLKVYPAAVEQALIAHTDVANAAVYGVRDLDYVEHVHAAVELRPDSICTVDQLRDHVAGLLSALHVPSELDLWSELPLNGQGKPDKAYLRSQATRAESSAGPRAIRNAAID
jgi:acyl-CoA synthetase (AMP-forming)/AMP-acid ligase II